MAVLIGVTAGRIAMGPRTMDAVDAEYCRAVSQAGGVPVIIPPAELDKPAALVERLDGLLLTGGGDINPQRYGAEPSPVCGGVDDDRDRVETAVVGEAVEIGMPVLGICRGCQLVNVALGGTLIQHLPEVTRLGHLEPQPRNRLVHSVRVAEGSLLESVVGRSEIQVNSIHHQAVDRVARGLRPVAWSDDGLVEAVEGVDLAVMAVQWHPESLVPNRPHLALFEWLVEAAAR